MTFVFQPLLPPAWAISGVPLQSQSLEERLREVEAQRQAAILKRKAVRESSKTAAAWHLAKNQRSAYRSNVLNTEYSIVWNQQITESMDPEFFIWMIDRRFEYEESLHPRAAILHAASDSRKNLVTVEQTLQQLQRSEPKAVQEYEGIQKEIDQCIQEEFEIWKKLPKKKQPQGYPFCKALLIGKTIKSRR